jgi:hypothetical protein
MLLSELLAVPGKVLEPMQVYLNYIYFELLLLNLARQCVACLCMRGGASLRDTV